MSFRTNRQSDMDDVILNSTEFGETISYTAQGGSAKDIIVHVDRRIVGELVTTETGLMKLWEYDILASGTDVTAPNSYDEYTIDSMTFDVHEPGGKTDEGLKIVLRHFEEIDDTERDHTQEISA